MGITSHTFSFTSVVRAQCWKENRVWETNVAVCKFQTSPHSTNRCVKWACLLKRRSWTDLVTHKIPPWSFPRPWPLSWMKQTEAVNWPTHVTAMLPSAGLSNNYIKVNTLFCVLFSWCFYNFRESKRATNHMRIITSTTDLLIDRR